VSIGLKFHSMTRFGRRLKEKMTLKVKNDGKDEFIFNHPKLSAREIAQILDDALDANSPLNNSYIEDAITHIRQLLDEIDENGW
jgi:hypothetical protein